MTGTVRDGDRDGREGNAARIGIFALYLAYIFFYKLIFLGSPFQINETY
jgi:hypothetical protein